MKTQIILLGGGGGIVKSGSSVKMPAMKTELHCVTEFKENEAGV